ncbi:MAG: glycosyltransferase family 4 protein [Bryobacterales bacterium]|nr:glycosyltransferase family 4 protein [Bryobacterales bacterium]
MRIEYVITRADAVGGASIHVRDLASAMQQRGHAVTVLVGGTGPVTEQLGAAGIPFVSLSHLQRAIHPWQDLLAIREVTAALRGFAPDIVSTHTAKAGLVGRIACRYLGIPALYTPHGWTIGQRISPLAGPVFTAVERLAARWSAAIVCVCEYEKQLAIQKRIAPASLFRVIHNGMPDVDPGHFSDPSTHPPRLCSVARFEAPKDHSTLVHALARMTDIPWQLDLVGDGPLQAEIETLVARLGLAERVRFLGYQRDPSLVLARSQIFVLSSRSEAFPRSILEAMRAGLPVVASDVGGVSESVVNEGSGLLAPAGNPVALASQLRRLTENGSFRQRLGKQGRLSYSDRFRFETMVETMAALYEELYLRTTAG